VDCHVDVPVAKSTDAWAGQHIGIQFKSTVSTNLEGGYWDLDNVRLFEGPALVNPVWNEGQFAFTLVGQPGAAFEILKTTNASLPASNWTSLGFLTNVTGSTIFTHAPAAKDTGLYRARQLP
jgi:hypothetical protein